VGFFKRIFVPNSDFEKWRRSEQSARMRGPQRGGTGYQEADRKLFPLTKKLISRGEVTSAHAAGLRFFDQGKIKGASRASAAKRFSGRYLKEHQS
jgi:hypothetical protein